MVRSGVFQAQNKSSILLLSTIQPHKAWIDRIWLAGWGPAVHFRKSTYVSKWSVNKAWLIYIWEGMVGGAPDKMYVSWATTAVVR